MAALFCQVSENKLRANVGIAKETRDHVAQPGEDAPPEIHPENEERENNLQSDAPGHSSESDSLSLGREDVG